MFGKRLKNLLKETNITQEQLAKVIGYSQRAVSKWINEQAEPTETVIYRCAIYFDVSADYLVGLEDEAGMKIYNNFGIHNGDVKF